MIIITSRHWFSRIWNCLLIMQLPAIYRDGQFSQFIKANKKYKMSVMNLINSILKSQDVQKVVRILPLLDHLYFEIFNSFTDKDNLNKDSFLDVFVIDEVDFENQEIFKSLILLYKSIQTKLSNIPQVISPSKVTKSSQASFYRSAYKTLLHTLSFYLHKYLKYPNHKQYFSRNINNFKLYLSLFTYETEEENNTYLMFFQKMIEEFKWPQVHFLLLELKKVLLTQTNYEKLSSSLVKLIMHSPYYLVEEISKAILYLLLSKRKHLQFFLTIKEKLVTSKNWIHRKNYIVLYAEVKAGSSYQFHKIIPVLNYKLITKQKCNGVKMEFLKYALKIYQSIDPSSNPEKTALKQAIAQMSSNQKDQDILQLIRKTKSQLQSNDINFYRFQQISSRNNLYLREQQKMRQKQALIMMMKKTKTQKDLGGGRKDSKSKTIGESRTSLRIQSTKDNATSRGQLNSTTSTSTVTMKKEITIVNVEKLKRPSTVITNKRSLPKTQEEKKGNTLSNPTMTRYMSGQMKNGPKVLPLRRESGFKKDR